MMWIGLTGGIATGKSTVSRLLAARDFAVVDADRLAREAVQFGTKANLEIARVFGPGAILSTGDLDRKVIGDIVFSDRTKLALLEGIIHPRVRELAQERRKALEAEGRAVAFYDVPLLFEKKMESLFDRVVVVACDKKTQRQRLIARDGFSAEDADRRLAAQMPIEEKIGRSHDVIRNDGSLQDLEREVAAFVARLPGENAAKK